MAILEGEEYPDYYLIRQSVFNINDDDKEGIKIMIIKEQWGELKND